MSVQIHEARLNVFGATDGLLLCVAEHASVCEPFVFHMPPLHPITLTSIYNLIYS